MKMVLSLGISWVALKRAVVVSKSFIKTFTWQPCQSSWAEEQPGCLAEHLPVRWWRRTRACSIPRRCGWRAEDDGGWFSSSCCLWRHYLPIPTLQRPNIQERRRGTLVHQLQLSRRSCLCVADGEFCPRGTEVRPLMTDSLPFPSLFLPFHVQTWLCVFQSSFKTEYTLHRLNSPYLTQLTTKSDWPTKNENNEIISQWQQRRQCLFSQSATGF